MMKIKKLSVLFAALLFVAAFCMAGCENSSQAPEAFAVSIYKVEKEQDEDGNVYITNYDLWKSYNVTPTQAIDLPDYDPETENEDCKVSYTGNYNDSTYVDGELRISGNIYGKFLKCKNKIQFMPSSNSIIFARERKKKTINFFYEGKNITEYLDETQITNFNQIFKNTYSESFPLNGLSDFIKAKFGSGVRVTISLYTKENGETAFFSNYDYYPYGNNYDYSGYGGSFTLIKSTDVYLKITAQ